MLKKLYILVGFMFLVLVLPAQAQHRHGHHHHHHGRYHWVAPVIIGGVVTYALTRPQQPPVYVEQYPGQPIILQPNQRLVCNNSYIVHSSSRGVYEVKSDCYIVQQ